MTKSPKKLTLRRDTLLALDDARLGVAGASNSQIWASISSCSTLLVRHACSRPCL